MGFVARVLIMDTHPELERAWRAIIAAPEPRRSQALALVQDLSAVTLQKTSHQIHQALASKNQVDEAKLARDLGEIFRSHYVQAEAVALGR